MNDLISRQAAINAFDDAGFCTHGYIVDVLEELPSAQPEVLACGSGELVQESGDLVQDLVKDCISRKMAIDEVKRLHDVAWANWKETRISANTMIDALKDLPSAQPELFEHEAYIRGFEHGRTQGMIDAKEGKK